MSRSKVQKVVIPVAGLGSRFLPVTKALPKELLPIVTKPIIHYIVEEAVKAGLETVIFITSRPKIMIEDYFDPADLASFRLHEVGKEKLLHEVLELSDKIEILSIRQYHPLGLGHAILQAEPVVSGQSFAVILGDDVIIPESHSSAIGQCIEAYDSLGEGSVIGAVQVPKDQTALYGIVGLEKELPTNDPSLAKVNLFFEKPSPEESPSTWAMPGRYIFEAPIIDFLKDTKPGKNSEIQLTDAMHSMLKKHSFYAKKIEGERFDTGDRLGYIIANISVALKDKALKEDLRAWMVQKLKSS